MLNNRHIVLLFNVPIDNMIYFVLSLQHIKSLNKNKQHERN